MKGCIYLKDNGGLTYEKREHVLPAGLGCVDKLKSGLVSDQANIIFSKFELEFLENTPLGFIRQRNIGKRGNLNHPVPDVVCKFDGKEDEQRLYISIFSKTYNIAQLIIKDKDCPKMISPSKCEGNILFELLKNITKNTKFKFRILPNCKTNTIIVTYCNKKWYCYHSFIVKDYSEIVECIMNVISQLPDTLDHMEPKINKEDNTEVHVGKIMDTRAFLSQYRVIIKTIINTLCYLFGKECVMNPLLDEMKLFALGKKDELQIVYKARIIPCDESLLIHPHRIKFYYNVVWHCEICLFYEWFYDFELPIDLSTYLDKKQSKEYIIDWQNRKSYTN